MKNWLKNIAVLIGTGVAAALVVDGDDWRPRERTGQ